MSLSGWWLSSQGPKGMRPVLYFINFLAVVQDDGGRLSPAIAASLISAEVGQISTACVTA
jgi:hypothetical protein